MLASNILVDYYVDMKNSSTTVRISTADHKLLRKMAREDGSSLTDVLESAITAYEKQRWLEKLNDSLANLKQDAKAWQEYKDEQSSWDDVLEDGIKNTQPKRRLA